MKLKTLLLIFVLSIIIGVIFYLESQKPKRISTEIRVEEIKPVVTGAREPAQVPEQKPIAEPKMPERAKEITTPDGFINIDKISIGELIGKKVILIDFWTYSCINCQRTIPYLNAWHEKYADKGLVIIGIHTPEFTFEQKYENVLEAVKKFGIKYPVVLDNDYSTWTAYRNRYWPRKYLIDIDGYIVYNHIGEGFYEETENEIRKALGLIGEMAKPEGVVEVDFGQVGSPEVYFGAARNQRLANGQRGVIGPQSLLPPTSVIKNNLYLMGDWNIQNEFAQNTSANAKIIFRYQAKNVYLVASAEKPVSIKIFKDGQLEKSLTVQADELYHLIENSDYAEHTLEILIEQPGLRAFTFTFG